MEAQILDEIQKAQHILLHCHPSPDPDSVGSVLAMKFALEQLGKKVTAIRGDSEIPQAFMHFPGAHSIVPKNFFEVDLKEFDLFIILDSGSPEMISKINTPIFPLPIKTIAIDHHVSNKSFADINLVDTSSPSVTFILSRLFKEWNVQITPEIASNLFIGMYTDTGGFRFPPTDYRVLQTASDLAKIVPDYHKIIFTMENSQDKESIYAQALALNSIQTFYNDTLAISTISQKDLADKNFSADVISEGHIANILKSVIGWNIAICLVEVEPNLCKMSLRTRDAVKFDVSKLAVALGGGGHKAAAGATLKLPLDEAVKKVVETAKVIYNL